MKTELLFEFVVDKDKTTIVITREFDAALSLVWDAFTKKEYLDQWGAPKPWIAKTKSMEFKTGGRRLYSMSGPEGQEHWSIQDYTSISPKTNIQYISNFADKDGNPAPQFKGSLNNLDFREAKSAGDNTVTTVTITIKYESLAVLEMMIEKGFREGMTLTLHNLERLILTGALK